MAESRKACTYLEIDLPICVLTHGVGHCQANIGPVVDDVWNSARKNASITLFDSDSRANYAGGVTNYGNVFAEEEFPDGELSYAYVRVNAVSTDVGVGVGNDDEGTGGSSTTQLGQTNNSIAYYNTGTVLYNGGAVATLSPFSSGSPDEAATIVIAVDRRTSGAEQIWFQHTPHSGTWNGSASNDPVKRIGGIDISAMFDEPVRVAASLRGNGSDVTYRADATGPCFNTLATCQDRSAFQAGRPEIRSTLDGTLASDSTTHNVIMPTDVVEDDLLIVFFANDGSATVTTPTGWQSVATLPNGTAVRLSVFIRKAGPTDASSTTNFATSASEQAAWAVVCISRDSWYDLGAPADAISVRIETATASTTPDPSALTVTWGEASTMFFSAHGASASDSDLPYDPPPGYQRLERPISTNNSTAGASLALSFLQLNRTALENPGPYEFGDSDASVLVTLAVRPKSEPTTLRFAEDTNYLPREIEALPSLRAVSITPAEVSLGGNLGKRASVRAQFRDHPHSDTGVAMDPYVAERPYNPYERGTFFGKFRARQPFLRNKPMRVIRGLLPGTVSQFDQGEPLDDGALNSQETRHFVVESFDGPEPQDGTYELTAQDILKFASGDRAQAPRLSNGFLASPLTDTDFYITLSPSGIFGSDYPVQGYLNLGGSEIIGFEFPGSGDTGLMPERGAFNTPPSDHEAQSRVQLCLYYEAKDPADIIYDLLVSYAEIPPHFIPLSDWQNETTTYLNEVYTALIADPTPVDKLISELIEQAGLVLWWSDTDKLLRLQVLRPVASTAATFDENNIIRGSLTSEEQPETRISRVWTWFAQNNPLEGQDDPSNYLSSAEIIETDAEFDYEGIITKKIFSRWIASGGRSVAEALNSRLLARYRDPPRKFKFDLLRYSEEIAELGGGYLISGWSLQDETGAQVNVPVQVTEVDAKDDRLSVTAVEALFADTGVVFESGVNTVTIDTSQNNVNLKEMHDDIYADVASESPQPIVRCFIGSGVVVGSDDPDTAAFTVGDWPAGITIQIINNGRIEGAGGRAGRGGDGGPRIGGANGTSTEDGDNGSNGNDGGTAFYTTVPVFLDSDNAEIWGGGGGGGGGGGSGYSSASPGVQAGGGAGGGGGAGRNVGGGASGGQGGGGGDDGGTGNDGGDESGGSGGNGGDSTGASGAGGDGGDGGNAGDDGSNGENGDGNRGGNGGSGGDAGHSIDGFGFVTFGVFDTGTLTFTPGATGNEDLRGQTA